MQPDGEGMTSNDGTVSVCSVIAMALRYPKRSRRTLSADPVFSTCGNIGSEMFAEAAPETDVCCMEIPL